MSTIIPQEKIVKASRDAYDTKQHNQPLATSILQRQAFIAGAEWALKNIDKINAIRQGR